MQKPGCFSPSIIPIWPPPFTPLARLRHRGSGLWRSIGRYWRLYVDPQVLAEWELHQIAGVLYHEVSHLLRGHDERRPPSVPIDTWNEAADAEINDDILSEGTLPLPGHPVTPARIGAEEGLTAEEYLKHLLSQGIPGLEGRGTRDPSMGGSRDGEGAGEIRPASGTGPSSDDLSLSEPPGSEGISGTDPSQSRSIVRADSPYDSTSGSSQQRDSADGRAGGDGAELGPDSLPSPGSGHCGSCATGIPQAWEAPPPGIPDAPEGIEGAESNLIRRRVAEAAESCGSAPSYMKRWAETLLHPKVSWQRILASVVRTARHKGSAASDYTFSRPSRRRLPGIVLPGLHHPRPSVSVVVDTSGSMNDEALSKVLAEVEGIIRAAGSEVSLLSVDSEVHGGIQKVSRASEVDLTGGGGTDMGVGIEAAAEDGPDLIVVLTDCLTPWPSDPPKGIAVVVGRIGSEGSVPAWAKEVVID